MSREIKFRVWDNTEKKWVQDWEQFAPLWRVNPHDRIIKTLSGASESPGYSIQQFTGLKDKNGKEIYDGDIIKVARCHTKSTESSKGHISCECVEDGEEVGVVYWFSCFCQWTISFEHIRYDDNDALTDNPHRYEVVGNTFENAELLKKV